MFADELVTRMAEKYAPQTVPGAPVEDEKTRANRERLEKQRYDAEVKEAIRMGLAARELHPVRDRQ